MNTQEVEIGRVIPYARNPRHNEAAVAKVAASIQEFGWRQPIVVDKDFVIIAGHTRLLAARQLRLATVPVHVAENLTPTQVKAYRLADNRTHEESEWDEELLGLELKELLDADYNLAVTGFDDAELAQLLEHGTTGLTDPDDVPPLPATPKSALGDVWLLGEHRVTCGDARDPAVVARLLGKVRPHLMVTDPPYGVSYDPTWRKKAGLNGGSSPQRAILNDDRADWREAWKLFEGTVAYIWHGGLHSAVVYESLAACGFGVRAQIVWVKTKPALSRGHYHWQHEPCAYVVKEGEDDQWRFVAEHEVAMYAVKQAATAQWNGGRKQSTVWFIEHLKNDTGHANQKPVQCMVRPIENNSNPGQAVYDPFLGSGTTLIAAEMSGRTCFGIELDPAYVDVAVKRWEDFTGREAIRDTAGTRAADVAVGRRKKAGGTKKRTRRQPGASANPAVQSNGAGAEGAQ